MVQLGAVYIQRKCMCMSSWASHREGSSASYGEPEYSRGALGAYVDSGWIAGRWTMHMITRMRDDGLLYSRIRREATMQVSISEGRKRIADVRNRFITRMQNLPYTQPFDPLRRNMTAYVPSRSQHRQDVPAMSLARWSRCRWTRCAWRTHAGHGAGDRCGSCCCARAPSAAASAGSAGW